MKKNLLVIGIALVFLPIAAMAQMPASTDACTQAQLDAQADVNSTLWFGAGCLLGIWGVGAAYVIEPSPPASRLIGMPPDYVAMYSDCYKAKAKSIQTSKAIKGCVVDAVFWAAYYIIVYVALASSI